MSTVVTIFVRHSADCKYAGDEFHKGCRCRKHLRWSKDGKQYRQKAGTRSWAEAELKKRDLEDQLAGRIPERNEGPQTLADAIEKFKSDKKNQGITPDVLKKYSRELERLQGFAAAKHVFTVAGLTPDLLIEYQPPLLL